MGSPPLNPSIRMLLKVTELLNAYHDYSVEGINHIPQNSAAILAVHHSLATYDAILLGAEIYRQRGILTKGLGDRLLFKVPGLSRFVSEIGIDNADPETALRLLKEGNLLGIAPGGMREALRSSKEKYRVHWEARKGFIKLSLMSGAPILLACCPNADNLYSVYENKLTKTLYNLFKVPLPLARGVGLSPLPRPLKLVHYIREPIFPPRVSKAPSTEEVDHFHEKIVCAMKDWIEAHQPDEPEFHV